MKRVLFFVLLISNVNLEMRTVHYVHMARNTRSNSQPVQTSYVYSKRNNEPPVIPAVQNIEPSLIGKLSNNLIKIDDKLDKNLKDYSTLDNRTFHNVKKPYAVLTEYAKSKMKLWPEKERSMSIPVEEETVLNEIVRSVDEEDTRTDTRNPYDGWPYFYNNAYDYEPHKYDAEYEKAKHKHHFLGGFQKVIPVHEDHKEDYPLEVYSTSHSKYKRKTTENPVLMDQPFFSYVLNDYFDKTDEEDPLTLKGFSWGNDFDNGLNFQNDRMRRFDEAGVNNIIENENLQSGYNTLKDTEHYKKYDNKHAIKSSEKGDESTNNVNDQAKHKSEKYHGFKDFTDSFANKFGSADQNKDSKYLLKMNADKGEKKKGFRKVYHKDEYQEDNEFYDNTNKNAISEEKGGTRQHHGGSDAFLRSHAAVALANEHDILNRNKDYNAHNFHKNHEANKRADGYRNDIDRFRDVAKHTAMSNNADYIDHFIH